MATAEYPLDTVMEYGAKAAGYFHGVRNDFIDRLSTGAETALLEVGCGTGNTAAMAKRLGRCGFAAGIELFEGASILARSQLDDVVTGDVQTVDLPWPEGTFDVLILSEVLEHLVDPWLALRRLRPLLVPGATVFASSPNVAHWTVLGLNQAKPLVA